MENTRGRVRGLTERATQVGASNYLRTREAVRRDLSGLGRA